MTSFSIRVTLVYLHILFEKRGNFFPYYSVIYYFLFINFRIKIFLSASNINCFQFTINITNLLIDFRLWVTSIFEIFSFGFRPSHNCFLWYHIFSLLYAYYGFSWKYFRNNQSLFVSFKVRAKFSLDKSEMKF